MWQLHEAGDSRSTQILAIERLESMERTGATEAGFAIYSLHQAEGRGQYGRRWLHAGNALALSLAWPGSAYGLGPWPLWVSLAVRRVLIHHYPGLEQSLRIKWPNDLLLDGRKLGGVLVQAMRRHQVDWLVAGVGLNGAWTRPQPEGLDAADLQAVAGRPLRPEDWRVLAQAMANEVEQLCLELATGQQTPEQLAQAFEAVRATPPLAA